MRLWVGAYADGEGDADGIGVLQAADADSPWASGPLAMTGTAVVEPGSASWLAAHPTLDVVYAALERDGAVRAYRRTGEASLAPLGEAVPVGTAVCHVAVSPGGGFLVASCWGDGRVVRLALDAAGRLAAPEVAPAATDPYPGDAAAPGIPSRPGDAEALSSAVRALREAVGPALAHLVPDPAAPAVVDEALPPRASRAHQAVFLPDGLVATTDLGLDLVRLWRPSRGALAPVQQVVLPRGSGPRHGLWHPSGHLYVLTELSREAFALAPDRQGRWRVVSGTPLVGTLPGDLAAELCASRDGETLFAAARGSDTIAVLRVQGAGETLRHTALAEVGTRWPRHHVVVRDTLLVAGQLSDEVVSLPLDERTGVPGRVRHRTPSRSPAHLLPFR